MMATKATLLSLFSSRERGRGDGELYSAIAASSGSSGRLASATPRRLNSFQVRDILSRAQAFVSKWDPNSSAYAKITSLWYESRQEAKEYVRSVIELQAAMLFLASSNPSSPDLIRAQSLMQTAMKRLEKEFYQILAANRDYLDPESVSGRSSTSTLEFEDDMNLDDEIREVGKSIGDVERVSALAMADLASIAECMIATGYGKECVKVYMIVRKSIIDEGLYRLGVERLSSSRMKKMDWGIMEMKIKGWIHAVKIAVKTLFYGERILCDHVFATSQHIREACFASITKEGAQLLFGFPEAVARGKKSPEKMFKMLDLYDAIAELWPDIESTFSCESSSAVRAQAVSALTKLGEAVRSMLADFEAAMQKDSAKTPVPRGGLHPLTRYVMNFLSLLADYRDILADIVAGWPMKKSLPVEISDRIDDNPISGRFAWLILVLLCKLDSKVSLYRDVAVSYLFLTNNLNYIIGKVQSSNLRFILGDMWLQLHTEKLRQYAISYVQTAWSKVAEALTEFPEEPDAESGREAFRRFSASFEEAYQSQTASIVTDDRLRESLKLSIARMVVPAYRSFHGRFSGLLMEEEGQSVVRYSPEDLENYISDLFYGSSASGSATSSIQSQGSSL
ncbi:exocyst complex component EXO70H1-like [Nymphaea colorata]|nr:exocyst complex component EXO70H1-like [Nymphaea colorata]